MPWRSVHCRFWLLLFVRVCSVLWFAATTDSRQTPQLRPEPSASAARILLLPRQVVAGEQATLAVLDVSGRLTPRVVVNFTNGDQVTTDATGRAVFAAPLNPGLIFGAIPSSPGRVPMAILKPEEAAADTMQVARVPRIASLADRFEVSGRGFCGDAEANAVSIGGQRALVLAASPISLIALPPEKLGPGETTVQISCAKKSARPFSLLFVGLSLEADSSPIRTGEHRTLTVRVTGTTGNIALEARNLSPEIAELTGAKSARTAARSRSSGGEQNAARFEIVGKTKGSFLISIRLVAPSGPPREMTVRRSRRIE